MSRTLVVRALLLGSLLATTSCEDPVAVEPDASIDAGVDAGYDAGPPPPSRPAPEPLIDLVDPFVGTGGFGFNDIGSTFPGPQTPFGMVRPGPDTMDETGAPGAIHCAGYHYGDPYVVAFGHTRMHGTGIPDYGHIGLMPMPSFDASAIPFEGHRSGYSDEVASPGYYAVTLERGSIGVELTASDHVAHHRYTFQGGASQAVLVDVGHMLASGMTVNAAAATIDPDTHEVYGSAQISGGYSGRFGGMPVYFVARFDRAFSAYGVYEGEALRAGELTTSGAVSGAYLEFDPDGSAIVEVEVAISFVDVAGARANLAAESDTFDAVRAATEDAWEQALGRIRVEMRDDRDFSLFYTALYHSLLMPTLAADTDGRYRGLDQEIHTADGYRYYTDFSLWDTYRTLHPLLTLVYPETQLDMLRSLAAMARDGGAMPRWPLGIGYTGGMLGDPGAIVLADSYVKGLTDFDLRGSYDALRRSALGPASDRFGGRGSAEAYERLGYVPVEEGGWSTSKTMEFAYADFALARLATALGETDDAAWLNERAGSWRNQWDPEREFFLGRHEDGTFVEVFYEDRWQDYYSEGNAWQYLWLVPHDFDGLAEQLGGRDVLLSRLRTFFTESESERRTGIPPTWYWHGNEPDLHASYLFTAMGEPEESARWTRWVARTFYSEGPRGLPGNDDGGTMSAWLVFTYLGFFPIAAEDYYLIGSPLVTGAELTIGDGTFTIEAPESTETTLIVDSASIDDAVLSEHRFTHSQIAAGSTLRLDMR